MLKDKITETTYEVEGHDCGPHIGATGTHNNGESNLVATTCPSENDGSGMHPKVGGGTILKSDRSKEHEEAP